MGPGCKLLLVDAMGVLYRAFHAIPDLTSAGGEPTNALYGFVRMLRQIGSAEAPTHWGVVFDGGLSPVRLGLLESYKAQRPKMPEALRSQIPLAEEYLDAARVARMRVESEEADDVMASVATWAGTRASAIGLATSDKDMFQLVDAKLRIVPLAGKGAPMGPDEVLAKTGVRPEQTVDWLALTGDASDNIPGVPGVGGKTAAALLRRFGTLDGLWARLSEVESVRLRDALAAHRDLVERNRSLVRLKRDLPCPLTWDDMAVRAPEETSLIAFFERMNFGSLVREARQRSLFGGA